jgi:uncharacterized repeat protein (TIGR02543 family)
MNGYESRHTLARIAKSTVAATAISMALAAAIATFATLAGCAAPTAASPIAVTGIALNAESQILTIGNSVQLTATIAPENASNKVVSWGSDAPDVATVSDRGLVTAIGPGTATITVTAADGGASDTFAVSVAHLYAVTFVSGDGSTYTEQIVQEGLLATRPAQDPTRAGYVFGGWYEDAGFATEWNFATKTINSGATVYSKWTKIDYTIGYVLNGGAQNPGNPSAFTIESAGINLLPPTYEGFAFGGWYDNPSLSGAPIAAIPQGSTGDKTYYAKWAADRTVTFNANGGTGTMAAQTIGEGLIENLAAENFSREFFGFAGWATDPGATTPEYANGAAITMGSENITLYAVWKTIFTYTVTSGKAYITGFSSYWDGATDIVIPSAIDGYTVDSVSLNGKNTITSVTIPNSVTKLSSQAFYQCSALTTVTLGSGITEIPANAFYYCRKLSSVTLGSSVTAIRSMAFYNCDLLASITLPSTVTSIEYNAFAYCYALTAPPLGSNLTLIGEMAFYYSGIEQATIPASVTSIGKNAFTNCNKLTAITVDDANPAYASADGVLFNKGKTTLLSCPLTKTGSYSIPSSVTAIADAAFAYSKLTGISIPASVTSIGEAAFFNCAELTSIVIPNGVTELKAKAFYGCRKITSFNIPQSVASIDPQTFHSCMELSSFTVDAGNASFSTDGVALYDKGKTRIIQFAIQAPQTSYTLPSTVTEIGDYAFYASNVTDITIPEGVTIIGADAFNNGHLTSVTLPTTTATIKNCAFWNSQSLLSITILATTPPTLGTTSLFTHYNRKVYVPASALAAYKAAPNWSTPQYGMTIEAIE